MIEDDFLAFPQDNNVEVGEVGSIRFKPMQAMQGMKKDML